MFSGSKPDVSQGWTVLELESYHFGHVPAGAVPAVVSQSLDLTVSGVASTQGGVTPPLEWDGEMAAVIAHTCRKMLRAVLGAGGAFGDLGLCLMHSTGGSKLMVTLQNLPFISACQAAILLPVPSPVSLHWGLHSP